MNSTDCVTFASHILLPIGSPLRSRNELLNPEEASAAHMFCCHSDNGGVYHCQRLEGGEVGVGGTGEIGLRENTVYKERLR